MSGDFDFDPYALLDNPELAKAPGVFDGKRTVPCGCTRDDYSSSHDSHHPGQYQNDYGDWETCGWCGGTGWRYAKCTRCGSGSEPATATEADLRTALQAIADLNPDDFMGGQSHLTPAFRTPNAAAAMAKAQQIAREALAAEAPAGDGQGGGR